MVTMMPDTSKSDPNPPKNHQLCVVITSNTQESNSSERTRS